MCHYTLLLKYLHQQHREDSRGKRCRVGNGWHGLKVGWKWDSFQGWAESHCLESCFDFIFSHRFTAVVWDFAIDWAGWVSVHSFITHPLLNLQHAVTYILRLLGCRQFYSEAVLGLDRLPTIWMGQNVRMKTHKSVQYLQQYHCPILISVCLKQPRNLPTKLSFLGRINNSSLKHRVVIHLLWESCEVSHSQRH